jgi:large subunit ribosomal protein L9
MEVILREHVDNVGRRGEIVKVADGYARNYLLPRKLALLATAGNKKQIERERVKFDAKELEEQKVAEAVVARLEGVEVVIARKAGPPQAAPPGADQEARRVRGSAEAASRGDDEGQGPRRG